MDIDFDCATHGPYANLVTQIDIERGTGVWKGSGAKTLGRCAAAWNTFWNIVSVEEVDFPPRGYGPPLMNVVGCRPKQPTRTNPAGP